MKWIYKKNLKNTARFTLGEYNCVTDKTLICVGINPSTAMPNNLDNTLKKVKSIALEKEYVNWVMINVYPQRATDPNNLHLKFNSKLHTKNLNKIKKLLNTFKNSNILFAYGDLINKRPYLKTCLDGILNLIQTVNFNGQLYCIKRTKQGNPVHPLYQKVNSTFEKY